MKRTSFRKAAFPTVVALALGLSLTACGASNEKSSSSSSSNANGGAQLSGTLNGAGSSAQEAAQGAWKAGFQSANSGVTVNYDPSGSGGRSGPVPCRRSKGVKFAGSDASLDTTQLSASKKVCNGKTALEVPNYISPIAMVYNLKGVSKLQLSPDTAAKIFAGKVTKWDDPAIKADNPGTTLPSDKITAVHRSDKSGTTKNFTDYLNQTAGSTWTNAAAEIWPYKSGEGANGTSGVIQAVTSGKGTIGYADASQAGTLGKASIKVGGSYVAPAAAAAAKTADISKPVGGRASNDLALTVNRTTTQSGAYPLVLVSYVIACPTYSDTKTADLVKGTLGYVVSTAGQSAAAKTAGSSPLSSTLSKKSSSVISTIAAK